jgi:cyclopropane fatty-acyl-phospholipid synthase-like methyltransferase
MNDPRRHAPATQRNRDPIRDVLARVLPKEGTVLEIASGSGEHAVYFAAQWPTLVWQPSDGGASQRASIEAWIAHTGVANVRAPLALDAAADAWPITSAAAVVCINMVHISPWRACEGLMAGAARVLPAGGVLFLYGPYKVGGKHTAPSNEAFDASLRAQDPAWGVRDLEEVLALAARHGLVHVETVAMPANNLSLVLRRS